MMQNYRYNDNKREEILKTLIKLDKEEKGIKVSTRILADILLAEPDKDGYYKNKDSEKGHSNQDPSNKGEDANKYFIRYLDDTNATGKYNKENYKSIISAARLKELRKEWKGGENKVGKTVAEICQEFYRICDNQNNVEKLLEKLGIQNSTLDKKSSPTNKNSISEVIRYSQCCILYGSPGTGKTRSAKLMAAKIIGITKDENDNDDVAIKNIDAEIEKEDGRVKLVQFHPSYSYFDFVEGIEAGENGFQLKDKILKEFCNQAREAMQNSEKEAPDANENYVLIIDEINRTNMATVLGELLYALEYRGKEISTGASSLVIPENLYLIGTMNTADMSISGIDYAISRRFDFIKVVSTPPEKENEKDGDIFKTSGKWFVKPLYEKIRKDIEKSVAKGIDAEDIMPGISYFLVNDKGGKMDKEHLNYKIKYEIIPLLVEYAKNGLFTKRHPIEEGETLYTLLLTMKYGEHLKEYTSKKQGSHESLGETVD